MRKSKNVEKGICQTIWCFECTIYKTDAKRQATYVIAIVTGPVTGVSDHTCRKWKGI